MTTATYLNYTGETIRLCLDNTGPMKTLPSLGQARVVAKEKTLETYDGKLHSVAAYFIIDLPRPDPTAPGNVYVVSEEVMKCNRYSKEVRPRTDLVTVDAESCRSIEMIDLGQVHYATRLIKCEVYSRLIKSDVY